MASAIVQLLPAPVGLLLKYKDGSTRPAVCLALVKTGGVMAVVPVDLVEGGFFLAEDNTSYDEAVWAEKV